MVECVECGGSMRGGKRGFSFCTPEGFACMCLACAAHYGSSELVFRRLKQAVLEQDADWAEEGLRGPVSVVEAALREPPVRVESTLGVALEADEDRPQRTRELRRPGQVPAPLATLEAW